MGLRQPSSRLGTPGKGQVQPTSIPASVGGINALDSLMAMPPQDCIYTYNLMPVEYGLRLRKGYVEWNIGLDGDVRTMIGYESNLDTTANDRLFAVTEAGIYNVTDQNQALTLVQAFAAAPVGLETAQGYGVTTEFTTSADTGNNHYLFYADYVAGAWQYTDAGGWTTPTWNFVGAGGGGAAPDAPAISDIAFVTVHKQRIWVIEENSSDAWYGSVASVAGDFKKFTFGSKMSHGGNLQGIYTWSLDGGDGLDDYLVAVSHSGDVLVYRGSDPTSDASTGDPWALVGSWFIGETPKSRRLAASFGSEMYLLSTYGLTNLRDLLEGTAANDNRSSPSAKINRFLRSDMETLKDKYEWAINVHPGDGFLQIVAPANNGVYRHYNQNVTTKAWGFWADVPIVSAQTWNGEYYIGSTDGITYIYEGNADGVTIAGDTGQPISFSGLTSFQPLGSGGHGSYKNIGLIRTTGSGAGQANIRTRAVYDYDVAAAIPSPSQTQNQEGSEWDDALWDSGVWSGGTVTGSSIDGSLGIGRAVAVGFTGNSNTRITVIGWDYMFIEGGLI